MLNTRVLCDYVTVYDNEHHTLLKNHISPLAVGLGTPWPLKWNNTLSVFKEK